MSTIDELETDELERSESASSSMPLNDPRLEFISSFTLSSLRLKQDKWHRMMATDSFRVSFFIIEKVRPWITY